MIDAEHREQYRYLRSRGVFGPPQYEPSCTEGEYLQIQRDFARWGPALRAAMGVAEISTIVRVTEEHTSRVYYRPAPATVAGQIALDGLTATELAIVVRYLQQHYVQA